MNLLLTSAGRRVELLRCFRADAQSLGIGLRILAADARPGLSAACQAADAGFEVPRCTAPDYVPALLKICAREQVGLLVPTIDTELEILSAHREDFAKGGTRIVLSAPTVVAAARDKLKTSTALLAAGIPVPVTATLEDYLAAPTLPPDRVVAKPRGGSSSVGLLRPSRLEQLSELRGQGYLVQELWRGREYTVNVFFDEAGQLRCAVPHLRIETRGGEVSKGRTERVAPLEEAARKLGDALRGARGPLCFQAIVRDDGSYAVFEINARFGGGYPLAHRAGARFTQWLLEEALGLPCTASDDWKEGVTMLRYDAAVFVDG